jgi:two-component system phosphate regulon response regulator PhoB
LETKIKAVLRLTGDRSSPARLVSGEVAVDLEAHKALNGDKELQLTQKEFDLLTLFLRRPEKVFTRNQLLNVVWGYESDLNSRTVDVHMAMLRKKLGEQGSRIRTLPKIGYLWSAGGDEKC